MTTRPSAPLVVAIVGLCLALSGLALSGPAAANENAAHALAEKFAGGAEKEEAKRRAAEEVEMLARAKAEADARKAAADEAHRLAEKQRLADERRIAEEKRAEEQRRLADEQRIARQKFVAEQLRLADEERLRAEAEEEQKRLAEERRVADEQRIAEQKRLRAEEDERRTEQLRLAEKERIAKELHAAEEARRAEQLRAEEARLAALAAKREAAHQRLTERLLKLHEKRAEKKRLAEAEQRRAEEQRIADEKRADDRRADEERRLATHKSMGLGAPLATATPVLDPSPARSSSTRVTILLAMDPGLTGIRRFGKKTADPVLCSGNRCWISAGTERSALAVSRGQALGPSNTMGRRAAACNRHLVCVFRNVELGAATASVQPIDLRIMRHDRREPLRLAADPSCRLSNGALLCDKLYISRSWRAWVVPERLAAEAGSETIAASLAGSLAVRPSAALHAPRL